MLWRSRIRKAIAQAAERDLILVVGGLLLLFLVANSVTLGWPPAKWDVMLISGWAIFLVGLTLVQSVPARLEGTIDRLIRRSVVQGTKSANDVKICVHRTASKWGCVGASIVATAMLIAFLIAFLGALSFDRVFLMIAEALGGAVAGFYLGRMCAFGFLAQLLQKLGASIRPVPGHVDGAGGLKPIGDFYFFQALVVSLPAAYLATWLLLLPVFDRYAYWRTPYQGLFFLAIVLEIGAFILPMWRFHCVMLEEKTALMGQADKLAKEITEIDRSLEVCNESGALKTLTDRRAALSRQYDALENMPVWPVDAHTRRVFTANNAVLTLPLVFDIAGMHSVAWVKDLAGVAQTALGIK